MSEAESTADISFHTNGAQSQTPNTMSAHIERHEALTPVSPAPIHVADASSIPVLQNQMDPALNTTHTKGPFTQDEDEDSDDEIMDDSEPTHSPDASTELNQTPMRPDDTGPNGHASLMSAVMNSDPIGYDAQHNANAPQTSEEKPKTQPNIDLQALLTRLSPATPQQAQQTQKQQQKQQQQQSDAPKSPQQQRQAQQQKNMQGQQQQKARPHIQTTSSGAPGTGTNPISTLPSPPPSLPKPVAAYSLSAAVQSPVTSTGKNSLTRNGLPSSLPNPASFQQPKNGPNSPTTVEDDDRPFTIEEEEAYERFLEDERDYVTKGQWDRFPVGSRLFIGNLPSEKVTKRDIFRIFSRHGRLAQISIKQAYGFVQFLDTSSCTSALRDEQGAPCKGRKMHLEVSKPQGRSRNAEGGGGGGRQSNRRSRSPDYPMSPRGGPSRRHDNDRGDRSYRPARDSRGGDHWERDRERDDYDRRTPPRWPRGRDDYRPARDGRDRSRSPPPRYRSRTPPPIEEVPLPRRAPDAVPEVQVIVTDEIDRNFLWFVEKAFRDRMIRIDTLFLAPRLDLQAVVRRQIIEGVQAVIILNRKMQVDGKINMQVFDRRGGESNVRFDEYASIDPSIACELVIRARQTHGAPPLAAAAPVQPQFGYGYTAAPAAVLSPTAVTNPTAALLASALAAQQQQPGGAGNNQLMSLITSLDPAMLQKLVSTMQQNQAAVAASAPHQQHQQQQYAQQQPSQLSPDLAALLAAANGGRPPAQQQQQQGYPMGMYGQPHQQPHQHHQGNGQQGGAGSGGGAPQLQNILETLGRFKQ